MSVHQTKKVARRRDAAPGRKVLKDPTTILPPEIVGMVFEQLNLSDPVDGLHASQVNRRWQRLAEGTPRAWAHLELKLESQCLRRDDLAHIERWFQRSKNCPVSLSIAHVDDREASCSHEPEEFEDFFRLLKAHSSQLGKLDVYLFTPWLDELLTYFENTPCPKLEQVDLASNWEVSRSNEYQVLRRSHTGTLFYPCPKLNTVSLKNTNLLPQDHMLANLRELWIDEYIVDVQYRTPVNSLLYILSRCPLLQNFEYDVNFPQWDWAGQFSEHSIDKAIAGAKWSNILRMGRPIVCPELTRMRLHGINFIEILPRLITPKLIRVELDSQECIAPSALSGYFAAFFVCYCRSQEIRQLVLKDFFLNDEAWVMMLPMLPRLQWLAVDCLPSSLIFQHLSAVHANNTMLLPNLQCLTFGHPVHHWTVPDQPTFLRALLGFVHSRTVGVVQNPKPRSCRLLALEVPSDWLGPGNLDAIQVLMSRAANPAAGEAAAKLKIQGYDECDIDDCAYLEVYEGNEVARAQPHGAYWSYFIHCKDLGITYRDFRIVAPSSWTAFHELLPTTFTGISEELEDHIEKKILGYRA